MNLSIIIVNYNAAAELTRCLESLHQSPPAIAHDIVVVDNASSDGSAARVRSKWPRVRLIELAANVGFAAGTNAGIRASSGDLLLFLNNDTIVPARAIDTLIERFGLHPNTAVAGPRLIDADGRAELSFGPMISPLGELRQKVLSLLYERGFGPIERWVERVTRRETYVDWVSGACLLVARADAESVGLLDERYFLYTEDVDFCAALRARGRRILFAPDAEITHLRGRSRSTAPTQMNSAYRRSQVAFYEKHHPGWAPVLCVYLRLKGQLPRT